MRLKELIIVFTIASFGFFLNACSDDEQDQTSETTGTMTFEVTDAPSDDSEVKGVFVTVAEVKVDGQAVAGFSGKQTIDLMAYQNGSVKSIGSYELDAKSYTSVTLVLDTDTDADGNSPGCYVLKTDNSKVDLSGSASVQKEITIQKSVDVAAESQTTLVIDVDIRKMIKYANESSKEGYTFVTDSELNAAARAETKSSTGEIEGQIDGSSSHDKVVVFAYTEGSYDSNTEMSGQGSSNIKFKNCITSAEVDANGNFTLAFLGEGDYEIHAISYSENSSNGSMEADAELSLTTSIVGNIFDNSISVDANATTTLDLEIL